MKTWTYEGKVFEILPAVVDSGGNSTCKGCDFQIRLSHLCGCAPNCATSSDPHEHVRYVEIESQAVELPPEKQAWFVNGGWVLEGAKPLNRLSTRIVQYLFKGDTEESGCVEQHAIHVPAGIWAWREKPAARPAPVGPTVVPVARRPPYSKCTCPDRGFEFCECPEKQTATAAPAPAEAGSKPTNPKDAIGVRKAPLSCVPMNVVAEMGLGMLEGAAKYGRHNYRGVGVRASVYFDATMRHLIAWWEGEDIDPDTGVNHIAKALASLAVLRDSQMQGKCTDDRPPRSVPFYADLNDKAGAVLDRHVDKTPKHYTIADVVTNQAEAP